MYMESTVLSNIIVLISIAYNNIFVKGYKKNNNYNFVIFINYSYYSVIIRM